MEGPVIPAPVSGLHQLEDFSLSVLDTRQSDGSSLWYGLSTYRSRILSWHQLPDWEDVLVRSILVGCWISPPGTRSSL